MSNLTIKSAQAEDLNTLLRFEQGVVEAERPFEPTFISGKIKYYDLEPMIYDPKTEIAVACLGEDCIGSGYIRIESGQSYHQHEHFGYVGFIYVLDKYRGRGYSQQILDYLINWAAARNVYEVRLDVFEQNQAAVRAYEKAGFQRLLIKMRLDSRKK